MSSSTVIRGRLLNNLDFVILDTNIAALVAQIVPFPENQHYQDNYDVRYYASQHQVYLKRKLSEYIVNYKHLELEPILLILMV